MTERANELVKAILARKKALTSKKSSSTNCHFWAVSPNSR